MLFDVSGISRKAHLLILNLNLFVSSLAFERGFKFIKILSSKSFKECN